MKRILFVGHSNYVQASNGQARNKRSGKKTNPFHSPSDAASRKEIGKLDYPLAGRKLAERGNWRSMEFSVSAIRSAV